MSLAPVPAAQAAQLIACIMAAEEVQHRLAVARLNEPRPARRDRRPSLAGDLFSAADFGLTAREAGAWGRLRAEGLSPVDAADVVRAARRAEASS